MQTGICTQAIVEQEEQFVGQIIEGYELDGLAKERKARRDNEE
jgi:hypothetical protein